MIDFKGITQAGNSRKGFNQDRILTCVSGNNGIFVVSDGMGGLSKGEYASQSVVDAVKGWWDQKVSSLTSSSITSCADEVEEVLWHVNDKLYREEGVGGATIVLLLVIGNAFAIINAGDSRIYYTDVDENLLQMSSDDIWENDSDFTCNLTAEEIQNSSERGKLTNAVGIHRDFISSINTGSLKQKCQFMLVSDGIYKYCSEDLMARKMRTSFENNDIDSAVEAIVSEVYREGAKDNLSMIIVSFR